MSNIRNIVRQAVDQAVEAGAAENVSADTVGRYFLEAVLDLYRSNRPIDDIRSELEFHLENLDPEGDHTFMRP